jgi:hypothetical protein
MAPAVESHRIFTFRLRVFEKKTSFQSDQGFPLPRFLLSAEDPIQKPTFTD